MDAIYFYTRSKELKKVLENTRFDYQRLQEVKVIEEQIELIKVIKQKPDCLIYYIKDTITLNDKSILHSLMSQLVKTKICLYSNSTHALDAWELEMFDFRPFPITLRTVFKSFHKYASENQIIRSYIPVKTRHGIIKLPFKNINYLKAANNFTDIFMNVNQKVYTIGKQLHEMEMILKSNPNFKRLGRFHILNMNNLSEFNNDVVRFYGDSREMKIKRRMYTRLRKEIYK